MLVFKTYRSYSCFLLGRIIFIFSVSQVELGSRYQTETINFLFSQSIHLATFIQQIFCRFGKKKLLPNDLELSNFARNQIKNISPAKFFLPQLPWCFMFMRPLAFLKEKFCFFRFKKACIKTCPKGFGLKLAKLGLKIPLKNKVKQKLSQAKPN